MSGLGALASAALETAAGAGEAGALAAAGFISADEADDAGSCLLQATADIIKAISTDAIVRDSSVRASFMLDSIVTV